MVFMPAGCLECAVEDTVGLFMDFLKIVLRLNIQMSYLAVLLHVVGPTMSHHISCI